MKVLNKTDNTKRNLNCMKNIITVFHKKVVVQSKKNCDIDESMQKIIQKWIEVENYVKINKLTISGNSHGNA